MPSTLDQLIEEFYDPRNGVITYDRIIRELQGCETDQERALLYTCEAFVTSTRGDRKRALEIGQRALEIARQLADHDAIARALYVLGICYWAERDSASALDTTLQSLAAAQEGSGKGVGAALAQIGTIYHGMSDYVSASEYLQRGIEQLMAREYLSTAAGFLANFSYLHFELDQYEQGLTLFEQARQIHEQTGNREGQANIRGNTGFVLAARGDHAGAIPAFREAVELAQELGLSRERGYFTAGLASSLYHSGAPQEALAILDEHEHVINENAVPRQISARTRAFVLIDAGNYPEATRILHDQLLEQRAIGEKAHIRDTLDSLRSIAKLSGDFDAYVTLNEEIISLDAEINSAESVRKLALQKQEREFEEERRQREKERQALELEQERERTLLYGALPKSVADRMLRGEDVSGDHFDSASVLFLDIVGFTTISDRIPPGHVVHLLKAIFKVCDDVCTKHGMTKIKTIGDSYLAVAGVPEPQDDHATRTALAAVDMMKGLTELELTMDPKHGDTSWTKDVGEITVRIGLHCGPLVAGIVGEQRLQYDVWGDTVNVASRMESTGEPGRIHVSEAFASALGSRLRGNDEEDDRGDDMSRTAHRPLLTDIDSLTLKERGVVSIKGKGPMTTYWLERA